MNRFDQIQAAARDVAQWVRAGVDDADDVKTLADDLILLVTLIVQATGKGIAVEGESDLNEVHARGFEPDTMSIDYSDEELASQEAEFEQEKERDAAKAHNRHLIGEFMQDAARETHAESTNPGVDLERYDPPVWQPRVKHASATPADPFEPGELTVKARAAADAMREGPVVPVLPPVGTPWKPEEVAHRRQAAAQITPAGLPANCSECHRRGGHKLNCSVGRFARLGDGPRPLFELDTRTGEFTPVPQVDIREASIRLPDAAARLVPVDDDRRPLFAPGAEAYYRSALGLPEKKDPLTDLLAPHTWVTATDGDTGRTLDWQHCGVCSIRRCDGGCGDASVGATPDIDCATHGDSIAQQCHGPRCGGCGEPADVGQHGLNQGYGGCV